MRRKRNTSGYVDSYFEDENSQEEVCVLVGFDCSPPEPDVNWWGDLEITSVDYEDIDITAALTNAEFSELENRLAEQVAELTEDEY